MRPMRWLSACLVLLAVAAPAAAQSDEDLREAQRQFEAGRVLFDDGDWEGAAGRFERAWALSRQPDLLYNLYVAYERAGELPLAAERLRAYIDAAPDSPERSTLERRLSHLEQRIRESDERDEVVAPEEPSPSEEDGGSAATAGWVVAGAGVAAAIGGTALLAVASGDASEVDDAPSGSRWRDVSDAYERSGTFSTVGAVLLGVGVAAAAVGLSVVLLSSGSSEDRAELRVILRPDGIAVGGAL